MIKKILTTFLILAVTALFAAYFYFAHLLVIEGSGKNTCNNVCVSILDSADMRFVSKDEIRAIVVENGHHPVGKKVSEVDVKGLENYLNQQSAIRKSEVAINREGELFVLITQRKPILRIENEKGGFYVDESKYIFPLLKSFTAHVPIVTGHIPFELDKEYRGKLSSEDDAWLTSIVRLSQYIYRHPALNSQIQQINVEENGDITLSPTKGNQTIIFGKIEDIEYKFSKLAAFYDNIIPNYGWDKYSEVNLKYSDQIICKQTKKTKAYE